MIESRDQGEPHGRSSTATRVGLRAAAVVLLLIVGVQMIRVMNRDHRNPGVGAEDPCHLQLVYVRPDCGDAVFDAGGQAQGTVLPAFVHDPVWKADEMMRKSGQMGVPVIDINGSIIVGFDKSKIEGALKR